MAGGGERPVRSVTQERTQIEADRYTVRARLHQSFLGSGPSCGKPHRHFQFHGFRRGVVKLEPMAGLSHKIQPEPGGVRFLIAPLDPIGSQIDGRGRNLRNHLPGEKEQDQDRSQHPSGARIHRRPSTEVGCSFRISFGLILA